MQSSADKTILVVDDERTIVDICESLLTDAGYTVLKAHDGAGVSQLINQTHVDLLLVDIFMPEVDGFAVIQKVRERAPGVVIVAMSGGAAEFEPAEVLRLCHRIGARAALAKPFTADALRTTIAAALA